MSRIPAKHVCGGTRRWDWTFPSGAETHGYDLDGVCVPGVTTINGILDKPALAWYYGNQAFLCAFDDPTVLLMERDQAESWVTNAGNRSKDAAAALGSKLHGYADVYQRTGHLPEPDEDIEAMVVQYLDWRREFKPTIRLSEFVVFNRQWSYGGTGDMLVDLPGYGTGYVDIKTGGKWRNGERDEKNRVHTSIYNTHGLQAAGVTHAEFYAQATTFAPLPKVDFCATLHIRPDFFELVEVDGGDEAFAAFCGLRSAYDWVQAFEPGRDLTPNDDLLCQPELALVPDDPFAGLPDERGINR